MTEDETAEEVLGYADALAELETILGELDDDNVDVDVLGEKVRRATELLRLCRHRIINARFEVEQVITRFEGPTEEPDDSIDDDPADG